MALRDLLYDPVENRWVNYFSDAGGNYPGIRAVGSATSKDLINWEVTETPLFTIDDYKAAVPHRIKATDEEFFEHGRVYLHWTMHHNGCFYAVLIGTEEVGYTEEEGIRLTSTGRVIMAADSPLGPFEYVAEIEEDDIPPGSNKPDFWNGRWYSVYTGTWGDQPGFGLA